MVDIATPRSIVVTLRANIEDFRRGLEEASEVAGNQADAMDNLGKGAIVMGGAMAAGLFVSAKAAIEWESAWAGVTKTVDGSAEQMAVLETELRGLATTLPTTHKEIAAVAEAAGQLGVKREDITGFTKTMIDLGETTNLSAEEAATSMAKLMNIMGTAPDQVDNLGAALVELGNNGASTEADIMEMSVRIAGAGKQIGLTEGEVFGFANALASVGIEAEAGGSSLSRVMIDISTAVESGGKDLATFAEVAGVSTAEFSAAFGQDGAGAVNLFIDGLGQMTASGQSTFGVLDELGLSEIRVRDALLRLSNAQGLATASTAMGNEALKANVALVAEADKRYETTASKIQVAKNSLNELAIDLGTVLLPAIGSAVGGLSDLAGFLSGLPEPMQAVLVVVGALGAALALTAGAALIMLPKILALQATLVGLGANAWTASIAVSALGLAMKAAGIAAGAVAIAAGVYLVGRSLATAAPGVAAMTENLREYADKGALTGVVARQLGGDFEFLAGKLEVANKNRFNIGDGAGLNQVMTARDVLKNLDETLAGLVTGGHMEEAASLFQQMATAVEAEGGSVDDLNGRLTGYYDALAAANRGQKDAAEGAYEAAGALGGLEIPLGTIYDSLGAYAEGMGLSEEATKDLTKQVQEWGETLAGFVEPLGAYTDLIAAKTEAEQADAEKSAQAQNDSVDSKEKAIKREYDIRLDAMKSNKGVSDEAIRNVEDQRDRELGALDGQKKGWEDYAGQVSVSVTEYLGELQRQVEAQEKHADNMTMLAGRVSQGTLDELARMGPEGAPLVAQLVNASDAELSKMDDLFRRGTSDATGAMAGELYLANVLLPQIASKVGQDTAIALATSLANGTTTVAQIARDYAGALAGGINPILTSLGKTRIAGRDGSQGGVTERADGGPVWGAGTATSDSIPALLSNGEYVIRASSVSKYGQQMLEELNEGRFARGGLARLAAGGFARPEDVPRPSSIAPFGPPISSAGDGTMDLGYRSITDFLRTNAPTAPGEAPIAGGPVGGNLVAIGRSLQQMGFRVSEHPAFGGVRGRHAPRSYHASGRAIDVNYGPGGQNAIETRAINAVLPTLAGRFVEKLWQVRGHYDHLHLAMAKGGLLNPHVRDRGGPLLPGHTFNGTGRPETVLPMASGGFVGGSVSGQAAAMVASGATPADLQELLRAWDEHLKQLAEAARRHELVLDVHREHAVVLATIGGDQQDYTRAVQATADAQQKVADFDMAARADAEKAAVDRLVDTLEAEAEARDRAADAAKERADLVKDRLSDLNALLDEQASVRKQMDAAAVQRNQARAGLRQEQAQADNQYAQDRREEQETLVAAEATMYTRLSAAGRKFNDDQSRILGARSDQLASWARLDERVVMSWGNSVQELLVNAQVQAEQFAGWADALAGARRRGVSEAVIEALGLDEGPQALNQLRQFSSATQAEIDALNAAVISRTTQAARQSRTEQSGGYGQVARDLAGAHAEYTAELGTIRGDFLAEQQQVNERLLELQVQYRAGLRKHQEALAQVQAEFLTEQRGLRAEFAAIGTEQGRSQGVALAEGLLSQISAVQAAARLLRQAMWVPASMVGGVFTDTNTGRAAYYGPAGEPGGSDRTAYLSASYRMPDGRTAWYHPGAAPRTASFDSGGWLQPGYTLAHNGTGVPERVMTTQQMSQPSGPISVTVLLGDREIRDIVGVEVDGKLVRHRTVAAVAGARG